MRGRQQTLEEIAAEILAAGPFPLFDLDQNIRKKNVYPHVAMGILGLFAQTCRKAAAETAFLRVLTAAVEAEPMSYNQEDEASLAAIAILKRHPELLFVKGMVTDHFGRKIFASPYQLFLGAGDVWALKQIQDEIISNIEDEKARARMQEQADDQFQQQFPNCRFPYNSEMGEAVLYDERNEKLIAQVIVQLESIADAITADPCTNGVATFDATTEAVAALREIFIPKQGEVIETGLHFPLAIMREIFRVYDAQFDAWSGAQLSFFSYEVIGAVLAASTAVDGQCYKNGLSNLDMNKGSDRRDGLFCRHPKGIPQKLAPFVDKLGRVMFVDPYNGTSCFQPPAADYFDWYNKNGDHGLRPLLYAARRSGNLMSTKTAVLGKLCDHFDKRRHLDVCC